MRAEELIGKGRTKDETIEAAKFHLEFSLKLILSGLQTSDRRDYDVDPDNFAQMNHISQQVIDDYYAAVHEPPITDLDHVVKFAYTIGYKIVNPNYNFCSVTAYWPDEWPRSYVPGGQLREMCKHASIKGKYKYKVVKNGARNEIRRYRNEPDSPKTNTGETE